MSARLSRIGTFLCINKHEETNKEPKKKKNLKKFRTEIGNFDFFVGSQEAISSCKVSVDNMFEAQMKHCSSNSTKELEFCGVGDGLARVVAEVIVEASTFQILGDDHTLVTFDADAKELDDVRVWTKLFVNISFFSEILQLLHIQISVQHFHCTIHNC
jgi:hypothetical protein